MEEVVSLETRRVLRPATALWIRGRGFQVQSLLETQGATLMGTLEFERNADR